MVSAKIGLMYVSDYLLSLGNDALNYTSNNQYNSLKLGWMHISNNDSELSSSDEWSMSGFGRNDNDVEASWFIDSSGYISNSENWEEKYVRPVFYLTSDVTITGEGSITNPYIIS